MKVRDIILELSALDPEQEIVIQKNATNTAYTDLFGIDDNVVIFNGNAYSTNLSAAHYDLSEAEWQKVLRSANVAFIFSINID